MKFMSPANMVTLGATVTGTVDTSYESGWLCDGDPSYPVRITGGNMSLAVVGTSVANSNAAVLVNHNLTAAVDVVLSAGATATITAPSVPPNDIRLNALEEFSAATVSGFTATITSGMSEIVIGELVVGKLETLRTLPPRSDLPHVPFELQNDGEFGGLSYDKAAESRGLSGRLILNTADKAIVEAWWRACRNNSKPSVIIPWYDQNLIADPWLVIWAQAPVFRPITLSSNGIWEVEVAWRELPRYRWP